MLSVAIVVGFMESPGSPLRQAVPSAGARHAIVGLAMGLTLIALVYSPWGGRSGAHMNPAVTLAFLRLGKIGARDAAGYIGAQCVLGLAGSLLGGAAMGARFTAPPVSYAPTVPGEWGVAAAFVAELLMTFCMMSVVLLTSNTPRLARATGFIAAGLLVSFITLGAPISGASLNPARTLASAIPSGRADSLWIYLLAPVFGMLAAAELFRNLRPLPSVHCCKLNHSRLERCPFCGCDGPIDFHAHRNNPR